MLFKNGNVEATKVGAVSKSQLPHSLTAISELVSSNSDNYPKQPSPPRRTGQASASGCPAIFSVS